MRDRKRWAAALALVLGLSLVAVFVRPSEAPPETVTLSVLAAEIRAGHVGALQVGRDAILASTRAGARLRAHKEATATLAQTLALVGLAPGELAGIDVEVQSAAQAEEGNRLWTVALVAGLGLALAVFWSRGGLSRGGVGAMGRSGARRQDSGASRVTFADVAGAEEVKEELVEIVDFLRDPQRFHAVGARIPKGVLLVGPPGTGKTLLAKAVAGEAGVPFFSISGSEFVEVYVGVGAKRVRDLFRTAKREAPCIVFIDEIDAVGRLRGQSASHEEREQTLNQLLVEMDGFDTDARIVVMAATNRADVLDPALRRPGRFDREVTVDRPDLVDREAILAVHTRGRPLAANVDLHRVAQSIPGFAGADIANLLNEAAILSARRAKLEIGADEIHDAAERILAGPVKRRGVTDPKERRVVAYHEAGHAIVMHYLPDGDRVHKVSIVSRGRMGGYTISLPDTESTLFARRAFMTQLAGLLGGRAAEELVVGEVTTGASSDLERATRIARGMATRYGMSDRLGHMVYGRHDADPMGDHGERRNYSESVAEAIDDEVRLTVTEAYALATDTLRRHRASLDAVATALLEHESLDAEAFAALCGPTQPPAITATLRPTPPAGVEAPNVPEPAAGPPRARRPAGGRPWRRPALIGAGAAAYLFVVGTGIGRFFGAVRRRLRRPGAMAAGG